MTDNQQHNPAVTDETGGINRRKVLKTLGAGATAMATGVGPVSAESESDPHPRARELDRNYSEEVDPVEVFKSKVGDLLPAVNASLEELDLDTTVSLSDLNLDDRPIMGFHKKGGKFTANIMVKYQDDGTTILLAVEPEVDRTYAIIRGANLEDTYNVHPDSSEVLTSACIEGSCCMYNCDPYCHCQWREVYCCDGYCDVGSWTFEVCSCPPDQCEDCC